MPVEVPDRGAEDLSARADRRASSCWSWRSPSPSTASAPRWTAPARAGARGWTPAAAPSTRWRGAAPAFAILEAAFLRSDFSFELVATHSSTTTPTFYRATAIWSSQEGSLLLWATLLSLWSSAVLFITRRRVREIAPYATAVLCGFAIFFVALLVFMESPFAGAGPGAGRRGSGLNPLLRHPSMMIHPPMLYSGYTLFAVPFAFAVGALITRRLNADWIRTTRPFTLAAWFFLGIGIVLGARWSYTELGWGGYWAWDPVENASLMPWLTGTAFLHSVMIQEKRGMLKVWNASLVLATGVLAILGTFLVRSGILESIHAFGASTLGVPFLTLIGVMIARLGRCWSCRARATCARSTGWTRFSSREAMFLLNNLVLVAMCVIVFWGTFFPLISEAITGDEGVRRPAVVRPRDRPRGAGAGPAHRHRAGDRLAAGDARQPAPAAARPRRCAVVAVLVLVVAVGGATKPHVDAAVRLRGVLRRRRSSRSSCAACARGGRWRGEPVPVALVSLVRRNRRRYGGYVVHLGRGRCCSSAIAASSAFQHSRDVAAAARARARDDRRLRRHVRAADQRASSRRPTAGSSGSTSARRCACARTASASTTLLTKRVLLPVQDPTLGPIVALLRGRGDQRGRPARRPAARRLDGRSRRACPACTRASTQGDKVFDGPGRQARRPRSASAFLAQALTGLPRSYRNDPPPATFRTDRLADGHLDLARRASSSSSAA